MLPSKQKEQLELVINLAVTAALIYTIVAQSSRISRLETSLSALQSYVADITSAGCEDEEDYEEEPEELPPPGEVW